MDAQPVVSGLPETTPMPILSGAQKDQIASAALAVVAVQQAASALAMANQPRRRPVSSGIFGKPVYDRDASIPQKATTPTIVPYGAPVIRPVVQQGPGPIIGEGTKVPVGGKVPVTQRYTGQTVFTGARNFQGMYGSSIFGGGVSGLGAAPGAPLVRQRRGGRVSGLGEADKYGYELAPCQSDKTCTAGSASNRCGLLGRNVHWDSAWPCNSKNETTWINTWAAWNKANPANQAAELASTKTPAGIPPYGKDAYITAICAGMAPLPPGFPMPAVCSQAAAPPAPIVTPSGGGMQLVTTPGGAPMTAAVAPTSEKTKMLVVAGGLAVAAGALFFLLKGKKKGAAAAPAAA